MNLTMRWYHTLMMMMIRYHTLTREEVYTTSSLMANLDQKEVDKSSNPVTSFICKQFPMCQCGGIIIISYCHMKIFS